MFPRPLFVSPASGEREDALPQTPECTDCTGLFKEAAGKEPTNLSASIYSVHNCIRLF